MLKYSGIDFLIFHLILVIVIFLELFVKKAEL